MIRIEIEKKLNTYQGKHLLKVFLEMKAGSLVKVSGPSGAGKTTFLKLIAGLMLPDAGRILVDNEVWVDTSSKINLSPQKRKCGFVFQDYALFPNMNVQQQLEYATKDQELIKGLLDFGRLEPFVKHKPVQLSGGQQQRLAILRALAIKPKLLLMDEPFSALDFKTKTTLIEELQILLDKNSISTIIVTHNPQELESLAGQNLVIGEEEIN
ncbi:ATP-binding cassette domain-containing protein [uncultured Mucilaginibacter sp.]|uniref:sulfate/molybdate ABC transporter ATP-binding protein n=1 Tax=uncultured Mucilaginibacter sp. TaxID=797541 RepID=UPI00262893F0|nr:ATP-binding cassette domain-containing protein [uncultured Mucilaginibacter sp.]